MKNATNIGKRSQLTTAQTAGGLVAQQTQLIRAMFPTPGQRTVTITPVQKVGGKVPWQFGGEGGAVWPVAPFDVPELPGAPVRTQLRLAYGIGAASAVAVFDYPTAGGVFGVTGDNFDLSVVFRGDPSAFPYATLADVPEVGAFVVDGAASRSSELTYNDDAATVVGVGVTLYWTVKPYARTLRLMAQNVVGGATLNFLDGSGLPVWNEDLAAGNPRPEIAVPPGAVRISYVSGGTDVVIPQWVIGLS